MMAIMKPIVKTKHRGTKEYEKAYDKLKETARAGPGSTITYVEVAEVMGINPKNPHIGGIIGTIVGAMSEDEDNLGKPLLSAIVVNKSGDLAGKPGPGFYELAELLGRLKPGTTDEEKSDFWKEELKRIYATYKE